MKDVNIERLNNYIHTPNMCFDPIISKKPRCYFGITAADEGLNKILVHLVDDCVRGGNDGVDPDFEHLCKRFFSVVGIMRRDEDIAGVWLARIVAFEGDATEFTLAN